MDILPKKAEGRKYFLRDKFFISLLILFYSDAKISTIFNTGVLISSIMCLDCGYVELIADPDKMKRSIRKHLYFIVLNDLEYNLQIKKVPTAYKE